MVTNYKFTDERDGNEYGVIRVGNQLWTAENLRFRVEGCSYMYDDDYVSFRKNGFLYNVIALDSVCPRGWHVPTRTDFERLFRFFNDSVNELSLVQKMSSTLFDENINLQLGGFGSEERHDFSFEGEGAYFWTSSYSETEVQLYCAMDRYGLHFEKPEDHQDLFSVRLVYNDTFARKV